jgi:hypothetical protein
MTGRGVGCMEPATSDRWLSYYKAGSERRRRIGGDYIRQYQERALARERLAMVACTGGLAAFLVLAYFILAFR